MSYAHLAEHERSLNRGLMLLSEKRGRMQMIVAQLIVDEIAEWLPILWRAMWFDFSGQRFALARHALFICTSTWKKMELYGGRNFDNVTTSYSLSVGFFGDYKPRGGRKCNGRKGQGQDVHLRVFHQRIGTLAWPIKWMWRELLVLSQARKLSTQVILDVLAQHALFEDVKFILRGNNVKDSNKEGYAYFDEHWDEPLKIAGETVFLRMGGELAPPLSSSDSDQTESDEEHEVDDGQHSDWTDLEDRYL